MSDETEMPETMAPATMPPMPPKPPNPPRKPPTLVPLDLSFLLVMSGTRI